MPKVLCLGCFFIKDLIFLFSACDLIAHSIIDESTEIQLEMAPARADNTREGANKSLI